CAKPAGCVKAQVGNGRFLNRRKAGLGVNQAGLGGSLCANQISALFFVVAGSFAADLAAAARWDCCCASHSGALPIRCAAAAADSRGAAPGCVPVSLLTSRAARASASAVCALPLTLEVES